MAIRLEQAGYPYFPGSHGIPFSEIGTAQRIELQIVPNRVIHYEAVPGWIYLYDDERKPTSLIAHLKRGRGEPSYTIHFDLHTKLADGTRHPDFFASKFIDFAFKNFELMGYDIGFWLSEWDPGSDNFVQFKEAVNAGVDLADAAMMTWSGRQAILHRFNSPEVITNTSDRVVVQFRR